MTIVKPLSILAAATLFALPLAAGAQIDTKPSVFSPRPNDQKSLSGPETGKVRTPEPCAIKPVMSDEELKRCGARPPKFAPVAAPAPAPKK